MPTTISFTIDDNAAAERLVAALAAALTGSTVAVHADYKGVRTNGIYDQITRRITITSGPLRSPRDHSVSGAAKTVVEYILGAKLNTGGSQRNGWVFWQVSATGAPLQSIR